MQGNSLRLRLTRPDVQRLTETGAVEESVEFSPASRLIYRVQTQHAQSEVDAAFADSAITVTIHPDRVRTWAESEQVGIYARSGLLLIAVEKDFRCLTRPLDDHERDTYPNPLDAREIPSVRQN
jgi:hypothetical protein